jgi:hypothetical protein
MKIKQIKNVDNSFSELIKKCKQIVTCDTARISKPLNDGKMFLIIGYNKNTKENKEQGQWINQNGEQMDFDYVEEDVIASGYTEKELIDSVKKYLRLRNMNWEEYFAELIRKEKENF